MSTALLDRIDAVSFPLPKGSTGALAGLVKLASVDIETTMVADLSGELHTLFDPICNDVLPIYFGPLLGRLYLEGL